MRPSHGIWKGEEGQGRSVLMLWLCSGKQGHGDGRFGFFFFFPAAGSGTQLPPLGARGQLAAAWTLCLLAHSQMGGAWTSAGLLVALDTHQPPSPVQTEQRTLWGSALPLPLHPYLKPLSVQNSCSGSRELNPADSCKEFYKPRATRPVSDRLA